jgi:hypothetical protein
MIAIRTKLFPELSEDCWLLYADGFGESTNEIGFTALDTFRPVARPPEPQMCVAVAEWRTKWNRRLRPFLLPVATRDLYRLICRHPDTRRLGDVASIGIGYVSGANDFFHLRPSHADELGIPDIYLQPTVRNGRVLPQGRLTSATVESWRRADDPILLLRIPKDAARLPRAVKKYLETERGKTARQGYKCRTRDPWYVVPDVKIPDMFLTYMSGREANLVRNDAGCTCTNSVHSVRLKDRSVMPLLLRTWDTAFVRLSCEIEGHPLGGGLLKLEPGEATAIALPAKAAMQGIPDRVLEDGIAAMQAWRHHGSEA